MNSEIAGKMTSAVSGRDEKTDAVAKELNATITEYLFVSCDQRVKGRIHTRNASPKRRIESLIKYARMNTDYSD